ncbi:MAG: cytochrome c family protein [Planctomycetes bacterium]|nr:cytochrome c family protein [Planctomycetota bacterium]
MKFGTYILAGFGLVVAAFGAAYLLGSHPGGKRSDVFSTATWERMASPGDLSRAHTFLEHNCAACHTSTKGPEAGKCIACHADNQSVLKRQPTAFHANVGSCRECHREHQGIDRRPTDMDHLALAEIGLRQLEAARPPDSEDRAVRSQLLDWIDQHRSAGRPSPGRSSITPQEAVLNCAACHSNKDRHRQLFGQDCAQCHTTGKWTIPEFRHPPPSSMDCAQCHQAPPSHYMMHFSMISARVAGKPKAQVNECYQCHQTTSWNDIKGVGWYKHH